jgi:uncharacterized damage-inducible protein DinB
MADKMLLLGLRMQELPITLRVFRAYPSDKLSWKPHEKSMTAGALIGTFIAEQQIAKSIIETGKASMDNEQMSGMESKSVEELATMYESIHNEVQKLLEGTPDAWWDQHVDFFGHQMPAKNAIWITFLDHIHHRGQLSVYIRLAGGLVPSIYGPSADDPGKM